MVVAIKEDSSSHMLESRRILQVIIMARIIKDIHRYLIVS
jgi:hypothetical protein